MDQLTEEQRAWWDEIGFSLPPEDASPDKWKQFISGMRYVFKFDGYAPPSEEALRNGSSAAAVAAGGDAPVAGGRSVRETTV